MKLRNERDALLLKISELAKDIKRIKDEIKNLKAELSKLQQKFSIIKKLRDILNRRAPINANLTGILGNLGINPAILLGALGLSGLAAYITSMAPDMTAVECQMGSAAAVMAIAEYTFSVAKLGLKNGIAWAKENAMAAELANQPVIPQIPDIPQIENSDDYANDEEDEDDEDENDNSGDTNASAIDPVTEAKYMRMKKAHANNRASANVPEARAVENTNADEDEEDDEEGEEEEEVPSNNSGIFSLPSEIPTGISMGSLIDPSLQDMELPQSILDEIGYKYLYSPNAKIRTFTLGRSPSRTTVTCFNNAVIRGLGAVYSKCFTAGAKGAPMPVEFTKTALPSLPDIGSEEAEASNEDSNENPNNDDTTSSTPGQSDTNATNPTSSVMTGGRPIMYR